MRLVLGRVLDGGGDGEKGVGRQQVVVIQKQEIVAVGRGQTGVGIGGNPLILRQADCHRGAGRGRVLANSARIAAFSGRGVSTSTSVQRG